MILFYIIIPIMVLAVAIAVTPVLLGSTRHNRAMKAGRLESNDSAEQEADFWHRVLGHRGGARVPGTPDLLDDSEVTRVVGGLSDDADVDGAPRRKPSTN